LSRSLEVVRDGNGSGAGSERDHVHASFIEIIYSKSVVGTINKEKHLISPLNITGSFFEATSFKSLIVNTFKSSVGPRFAIFSESKEDNLEFKVQPKVGEIILAVHHICWPCMSPKWNAKLLTQKGARRILQRNAAANHPTFEISKLLGSDPPGFMNQS
jgi:hypothetical protein